VADPIMTKRCSRCKLVKPATDFSPNRRVPSGLASRCKSCCRMIMRQYREAHLEETRKRDRECVRRRRKLAPEKHRAANRKYYEEHREECNTARCLHRKTQAAKDSHRKCCKKHPEKRAAKTAVQLAVREGSLLAINKRTCTECGKQATDYHHPNGYDRENHLNVIPLCHACHMKIHRICPGGSGR